MKRERLHRVCFGVGVSRSVPRLWRVSGGFHDGEMVVMFLARKEAMELLGLTFLHSETTGRLFSK